MMQSNMMMAMVCLACRGVLMQQDHGQCICVDCKKTYTSKNGVPDFRHKDDCWCNVNQEKMQSLNQRA